MSSITIIVEAVCRMKDKRITNKKRNRKKRKVEIKIEIGVRRRIYNRRWNRREGLNKMIRIKKNREIPAKKID